jgi:putative flavoprotein involved in K+ transport
VESNQNSYVGKSNPHFIYDVIVIGAGQSGIYTSKLLKERGLNYVLLEKGEVAQAWFNRFPEMMLFSSRRYSSLPGYIMSGKQKGFPNCLEAGQYFQNYARREQLNIHTSSEVTSLTKQDNVFHVEISNKLRLYAYCIVNATGANQVPKIPEYAVKLNPRIMQLDSLNFDYKCYPEIMRMPPKNVLIVGDGASGRFIAAKLAPAHHVILSKGRPRTFLSKIFFGRELFWWLHKLGIAFADKDSLIAKILRRKNPVPCPEHSDQRLKKKGVRLVSRVVSAEGTKVQCTDGSVIEPSIVIWTAGYREDTNWLNIKEAKDTNGTIQSYGDTPVPGLYVLGRKWLSCRGSDLIMGVEHDATRIVESINQYLEESGFLKKSETNHEKLKIFKATDIDQVA